MPGVGNILRGNWQPFRLLFIGGIFVRDRLCHIRPPEVGRSSNAHELSSENIARCSACDIFLYSLVCGSGWITNYMAFFWRRKKEDTFSSSVLGLDKSVEELKAREEAVEREISVRFTKAIEKTRHSINNRLDTIFEGRKQIEISSLTNSRKCSSRPT